MKKILIIVGVIVGLLISLIDSTISYSDTASLDNEMGIEIISPLHFIFKTLIYGLIGAVIGWSISIFLLIWRKK